MERLLGARVEREDVLASLSQSFARVFGVTTEKANAESLLDAVQGPETR